MSFKEGGASEAIHHPAVRQKDLDLLLDGPARGNVGSNAEFTIAKKQYNSLPETIYK